MFQHEDLSVKMFEHLVETNKLDADFKKYLKNFAKDKTFIKELIKGPLMDKAQVQEHEIIFFKYLCIQKLCTYLYMVGNTRHIYHN